MTFFIRLETVMAKSSIHKTVSILYVISKYCGVSPFRIVHIDKKYQMVSKPLDFICAAINFVLGLIVLYLSITDQLGVENLATNAMTQQGSTFLIRTVIPVNSLAIIITFFRRKKILSAVNNLQFVDQELEEIGSPMDCKAEFDTIILQLLAAFILTFFSGAMTYAILRDITDPFIMFAQLLLCYIYNTNYLLFVGHFIGATTGVKRRFIKLNYGFK